MRVLFYNWVDYRDAESRGGGVSVYQRHLVEGFKGDSDMEVVFLSSGISYDVLPRRPRWERVRHGSGEDRARRFEIVNSGVLAPSHFSFGNPAQVTHPPTTRAVAAFLRAKGPFDIVHFHNLEGIPAEVLELRAEFPATRFVLSAHNYYPVCPQVNLWYRETALCEDFQGGRACRVCLLAKPEERAVRQANAVAFNLKKAGIAPGSALFDRGFRPALKLASRAVKAWARLKGRRDPTTGPDPHEDPVAGAGKGLRRIDNMARSFAERRSAMVAAINRNCDAVLGVSERVSEILRGYGFDPGLVRTLYIGTRQAEKFAATAPKTTLPAPDGTLTLAYLGYMRADKGFFFLLRALAALPDSVACRLHLVIAAPRGRPSTMARITRLADRFASVNYADGYTHATLDSILDGVDVGVVPVLWEDNLPQVAIEMHARHIPLLTSDRGGAKELGNHPPMVFPAGDSAAFADRVAMLLAGRLDLAAYWAGAMSPESMTAHRAKLKALYAELAETPQAGSITSAASISAAGPAASISAAGPAASISAAGPAASTATASPAAPSSTSGPAAAE